MEPLECRRVLAELTPTGSTFVVDSEYEPTALIVQFRESAPYAGSLRAHSAGSVVGTGWEIAPGMREVDLADGVNVDEALAAYEDDPNVLFAEPDYRVRVSMIPNDPAFATDQWALNNTGQIFDIPGADIRAPAAWDVTTGDPSVVVAVVDTGIDYTHPDLAANMWTNPGEIAGNGLDDDSNGYIDDIYGYDFANDDGDPMDDYFHGTHVAGSIAAVANNGIGIAGVAPSARLMALKFLDESGSGLTSDAIAALNYAVANGASISNHSYGGGPLSNAFGAALQRAAAAGHIVVASAGNYSNNNDSEPFYPASYNVIGVVSVAATDVGDHIAWFSNYGKTSVDIGAPGVDIYSTLPTTMTPGMINQGLSTNYGTLSGTSMAAPHVAGVMALVRAHSGGSIPQVMGKVFSTVDKSTSLTSRTVTGGRVNAAAALGVAPVDSALPRVVSSDPSGVVSGMVDRVQLTFSEAIDPSTFDLSDVYSVSGPLGPVPFFTVDPVLGDNRRFMITFEPQTEVGEYSVIISPHIQDMAGNELDQDRDGVGGTDSADEYTARFSISGSSVFVSPNVPLSIRGFDVFSSFLTIDEDLPIADVNVNLNLSFPRVGNLHVWLVSPAGTLINLSYRHGGNEANFLDTEFDDEAGDTLDAGAAPFTGSFQPDDPLSLLDEENARGTWQLSIQNVSETRNRGTLNSWSLEIVPGESTTDPPPVFNDPPIPGDDAASGFIDVPLTIEVATLLANDSDPNDDFLWISSVAGAIGGDVQLNTTDGTITFSPDLGGVEAGSFQYLVTDGIFTSIGTVNITLRPRFQLHNGPDVNADGIVASFDILLVINHINAYGSMPIIGVGLSAAASAKIYFDVVPDNIIAPNDALAVVNYINSHGMGPLSLGGGGEGEAALRAPRVDAAAVDPSLVVDLESARGATRKSRAGRR